MEIKKVETRQDYRNFIRYPGKLYEHDSNWVPPLWGEEYREYARGKNAVLAHSDFCLFLAMDEGKAQGRIIAYADQNYIRFTGENIGFFGSFESSENPEAATLLFRAAESWLSEKGMTAVRGPINPVSESWGFVLDGFNTSPIFMSPYNPPYYNDYAEAAGFAKVKDLLVYEADVREHFDLPGRFNRFEQTLLERRPEISVRMIDPGHLDREAESIRQILNTAVAGNWGFVPVEEAEMLDVLRKLKPVLEPRAIWFVEAAGRPVACCLGFPDINKLIKKINGRMFPLGIFTFLYGLKKIRDYRLWGLAVLPEYQGMGLDVLLYTRIYRFVRDQRIRLEANYVLEDNLNIRNALEKLGMKRTKTYRVYQKSLK
jgi:ribosomal protein S18 acetylase RimI-like enzyme